MTDFHTRWEELEGEYDLDGAFFRIMELERENLKLEERISRGEEELKELLEITFLTDKMRKVAYYWKDGSKSEWNRADFKYDEKLIANVMKSSSAPVKVEFLERRVEPKWRKIRVIRGLDKHDPT
jgi:hypothetical protein